MAFSRGTHFGTITHGTVTVGASSAALTALADCKAVIFQADHGNAGPVYVQKAATATTSAGWRLNAGEKLDVLIPCNNMDEFAAISDGASRTLRYIAFH